MAQQKAVEWLINELELYQNGESKLLYVDILEQAKQMEKEQIIEAYYQCGKDNFEHIKVINRSANEYYNETYKQ